MVDLDGVVDDEFCRRERVNVFGGPAKFYDGVAHGCEIDNRRNAGEILQDNPRRGERDFRAWGCFGIPVREGENVIASYVSSVFVTKQVLHQDLKGIGKAVYMAFFN